jgi:hypothetical protein
MRKPDLRCWTRYFLLVECEDLEIVLLFFNEILFALLLWRIDLSHQLGQIRLQKIARVEPGYPSMDSMSNRVDFPFARRKDLGNSGMGEGRSKSSRKKMDVGNFQNHCFEPFLRLKVYDYGRPQSILQIFSPRPFYQVF